MRRNSPPSSRPSSTASTGSCMLPSSRGWRRTDGGPGGWPACAGHDNWESGMSIQILMPALSPTMEEGKLAKWLVKEGDEVHSGDILAEIETDKATMEFEAVDEGRVGKLLVEEGAEGVKVNQPIATLLQNSEDPSASGPPQPIRVSAP